jgi:hypothetical protein
MNFFHQMKSSDTNIIHFDNLNQYQQHIFFSISGTQRPLTMLSQLGTKK